MKVLRNRGERMPQQDDDGKTTRRLKRAAGWMSAVSGLLLAFAAPACQGDLEDGKIPQTTPPDENGPAVWNPGGETGECNVDALLAPRSYGAKAKMLLSGLALTDDELVALDADPTALGPMIDAWLATDESRGVLERFFMTAFQQNSGNNETLFYLLGRNATGVGRFEGPQSPQADEMLNANFNESFARTVAELVSQGVPFSEAVTTERFMMTTALMSFLAFTDDEVVDDDEKHTVRTTAGDFDTIRLVRDQASAPPVTQALNPGSANFGTFWHAGLANLDPACNVAATQTIDTTQNVTGEWRLSGSTPSFFVFSNILLGRHQTVLRHGQTNCNAAATNRVPLMDRNDFSDWRMVNVRRPNGAETPSIFYDLPALRSSTELALHTERLGFMTTPGFFSTWMNNEDNSSRVTINQILIVALGKSFEGVAVSNFDPPGLDPEHTSESECFSCHQTLDPMRNFVRNTYTNHYGQQLNQERIDLPSEFVFGGVQESGSGMRDLATMLKDHPAFPYAWAHKLCFYANASACVEGEELERVVTAFRDSDLDFRVLVRELFSSPLITGAQCVSGIDAGSAATIARRSTFCQALSNRLGTPDICGLRTHSRDASTMQNKVRDAVASVPDDSFSRSVVEPVVIGETGLFTRANREAACVQAALNGYATVYGMLTPEEAMLAMVTQMMGLPESDPRHTEALQILADHVAEAIEAGKTETQALQSAFAVACMSPTIAGVGF